MGLSIGDLVAGALVAVSFLSVLLSSAGLVAATTGWDKLHYTGPANVVGPVAIAGAVLVEGGVTSAAVKSALVAIVLLATGPVLVHATGRAARVREHGRFVILSEELEHKEHRSNPSRP
jgi:multisubunit Na+/H+ antiporter MnhG subunit